MKAFVLIQRKRAGEPLGAPLRGIPGVEVELADDVTGPFDAIALVTAASSSDLADMLVPRIRALPDVTHVLWAPLADSSIPDPATAGRAA